MHRYILGAESGFWPNSSRRVHMYFPPPPHPQTHIPSHSEVALGLGLWGLSQIAWEDHFPPLMAN